MATTTLGTTLADFADRSVGLGYPGGVAIVSTLLAASLALWYRSEGTVSVQSITRPKVEWFYWVTILFPDQQECSAIPGGSSRYELSV